MTHQSAGPDYGTNFGLDTFGIPGLNSAGVTGPGSTDLAALQRHAGVRHRRAVGRSATTPAWTPVWRKEVSYTASVNLTKVSGPPRNPLGLRLRPADARPLAAGSRQPARHAVVRRRHHRHAGLQPTGVGGWNSYAAFLLGQMSGFSKSVQFEEMTGRENQFGLYLADRWQVNEKLTLNLGLRYEYYPLMSRADRGLEQLDYNTFNDPAGRPRRQPEGPRHQGGQEACSRRVSASPIASTRTRCSAPATARPSTRCRGRGRCAGSIRRRSPTATPARTASRPYGTLANGIPGAPNPDIASGNIPLPRGVAMRSPDPNDVKRGPPHSWNVFIERRLPLDMAVSVGYVGTRTDGGYADINLNYAESGGNANRQFFAQAGNADILDWAARTRSRYHSLQIAVNRPFKGGLLLKGAYTFSKALNEADDDGWTGPLTWNQPSQHHRNYARAGFDRPHVLQMGFVYELPFARDSSHPLAQVVKNWQISGIGSWHVGPAVHHRRRQRPAAAAGRHADDQRDRRCRSRASARPVPNEQWYDPALFSQPGNAWGNTGRNAFRGPSNWNLDASLFRTIPIRHAHARAPRRVAERPQPPAVGQPGDRLHRCRTSCGSAALDTNGGRPPRTVQLGIRFAF